MLSSIALFMATKVGRYAFAGSVLVALIVSFAVQQRNIGAKNALVQVQETTRTVVTQGRAAGNKSLSGSGGVQLQFRD